MAIFVPHQSQAEVYVGPGGRAANYAGAGAFMTPGQTGMPGALEQFSRGLDKFGGAVFEVGIEHQRIRNTVDMLEDELAEKEAYRAFREDYEKNNMGAEARGAAEATDKYFQTRLGGLRRKWNNPGLASTAETMLASIRDKAMGHAVAYSERQEQLHLRATNGKALGEALLDFSDPSKTIAELGAALSNYEASLRVLHGQRYDGQSGTWAGGVPEAVDAALLQAKQSMYAGRVDSLVAAGRFGEARVFIRANARGLGGVAARAVLDIERRIETAESRRLRLEPGEFAARRAGVEKDIYARAYDKSLTRDDIEAARDTLTPEDYFKMLGLIEGKNSLPERSDPEALIALQRMAVTGDEALRDTADDFLRAGALTFGDYSKMLGAAQEWRKPVIRQVDETLRLKTGYSEINPDPDAGSGYLMARDDFQDWLDSPEGKKSGDDAKIRMARRIGDNYRVAQAESILSVPVPLFLAGSRTMPDIKATIAATNKARAEGRITETEYAAQARRIKRMADIIERRRQRAGAVSDE